MSVQKISHKNKIILYVDFRGQTKPEQQIQTLEEAMQVVKSSPVKIAILINFEGSPLRTETMNQINALTAKYRDNFGRQALLGFSGVKSVILQGMISVTGIKDFKTFDDEAQAKNWLVGEGSHT